MWPICLKGSILNLQNTYLVWPGDKSQEINYVPKHKFKSVKYYEKFITWRVEMIDIYLVYAPLHRWIIKWTIHGVWHVEPSEWTTYTEHSFFNRPFTK